MSINSVQLYIKGQLDQMTLPVVMAGSDKLTAIVTPPVVDDRVTARCWIWGSTGDEKRRTMPRGGFGGNAAFKGVTSRVDIWVKCYGDAMDVQAGTADSPFPTVLEEIMNKLRTVQMPILNLLDTSTGRTSDIISIGEDMKWDYSRVYVTADQRMLIYEGRITATITEWIQA